MKLTRRRFMQGLGAALLAGNVALSSRWAVPEPTPTEGGWIYLGTPTKPLRGKTLRVVLLDEIDHSPGHEPVSLMQKRTRTWS